MASRPRTQSQVPASPNMLATYSAALADAKLIQDKLTKLMGSDDRHGDLQVVRSAARRLVEKATLMVEHEETS